MIFLLPLYAGYIFYLLLNLVFGSAGILSMRDLGEYREMLEENIETIKENHEVLAAEFEGLKSNAETLALQARNIGYYRPEEGVIEVEGFSPKKNFYPVGKLLRYSSPVPFKKAGFRTVSLAIILLTVILALVWRRKANGTVQKGA